MQLAMNRLGAVLDTLRQVLHHHRYTEFDEFLPA